MTAADHGARCCILLTVHITQIVVAEHDDWGMAKVWPEDAFTARIEAVAVDQCENWLMLVFHDYAR